MEKFVKKSAAEIAAMTAEEQEKYLIAKEAHEAEVRKNEITTAIENFQKSLEEGTLKDLDEDLQILAEKMRLGGNAMVVTEENLLKTIADKQEDIKNILKAGSGLIELVVIPKAAGTITTQSGSINGFTNPLMATQLNPLQRIDLDIWDIENEVTTFSTDSPVYSYTYAVPKDGKYDFQKEGELKKQIDFTWKNGTAEPLTFAAWEKLTEQAVQDVKGLLSVAKGYLKDRHDYDKALAIVFGNEENDIKGIIDYATPFTAGALAASVEQPLLMDTINAGILSIRNRTNYPGAPRFRPNVVYMNPMDFFIHFTSAKDSQGKPLYPTAQAGIVIIGNAIVKERFEIPQGKIFIGDLKKVMLSNYLPYTVKIGWVNDDFIRNQFVLLGESRFHLFVKELDKAAFLYDDIATIKTAITKPIIARG